MSPKRRKPVRLPEECIHTIAQTVGVTLTPEVAKLLAPDAEYRLRELIRNAKSYMRHSKRTRLTVQDISLAHKLHLGSTLLGHGQEGPSGFAQVTNGVFVEADSIQALHEIFVKPLPRSNPSTSLKASWIRSNHTPGDKSPQSQIQHDESFTKSMRAILLNHDEPLLGATLRALPQLNKSQMNELVSLLTHITNDNATPGGNSSFLYNALRMTCKLFISDPATAEMYNDDLIPIILTCLLGKHLGDGDQLALRQRAAWSLQEWRHMTADKAALARVVKTIVCCLTDREAPIDTVFGAVHGLGAMGREIFQMHFTPHLPALSESLRLRLEENKEGPVGKEVAEQVANLIQAVSDTAAKFDTELVSEMRDIV